MTQPPRSGQSAPVDPPSGGQPGTDRPANPYVSGTAWTKRSPGESALSDAPTGTLPAVGDGARAGEARATASTPLRSSAAGTTVPATAGATTGTGSAMPGSAPSTAGSGTAARPRTRGPRRAQLQLRHINPWTALKFSSVLGVALFFVWLIVVGVLYGVLDAAGVISRINDAYTTIQPGDGAPVTAGVVFGVAAIVGVINVVLFIALSAVGSLIYNLCADLVGGVEVTLSES